MSLYDEILAGGFDLQNRDDGAIAAALSMGRTKLVPTEIGIGTILETIGISAGNALLDAVKAIPDFRYVWPMLEQGRLRIDSQMVRTTLDNLAANGVITAEQATALKNLALQPDIVTPQEVAAALEGK